ncbi:glycosyltransferase family 4 protein, partial [Nonomuraea sp. NPDC049784]|uniref:glycosyltransferase family 4 protein n=1 Tax=Nonomuraea sp. NPDC049784 TaxID=3154361 RepID=UPI003409D068
MSRVVTALDLPAGSPGGSVELLYDLYTGAEPLIAAQVFMLASETHDVAAPAGVQLVTAHGKCVTGLEFWSYVKRLRRALAPHIDPDEVAAVHLQHLAFGATPALIGLLPKHPRLALVHGTDLIFAARHQTQKRVLLHAVEAARHVVVPTTAMADMLATLTAARATDIVHIPWGIPDELLHTPPQRAPHRGPLRLLYAGRLSAEKGADTLVRALATAGDLHLSVAAPAKEYAACEPELARAGCSLSYLGWLPRPRLWRAFADHDLLLMPSTTLEAFGLVAVEAQACGLPVLYRPVPGLSEVMGDSALGVDLTDPTALARVLHQAEADPSMLD